MYSSESTGKPTMYAESLFSMEYGGSVFPPTSPAIQTNKKKKKTLRIICERHSCVPKYVTTSANYFTHS